MRWHLKRMDEQPGDVRTITKFLLRPRRILAELRWLERATIRQECVRREIGKGPGWYTAWVDVAWVDGAPVPAKGERC